MHREGTDDNYAALACAILQKVTVNEALAIMDIKYESKKGVKWTEEKTQELVRLRSEGMGWNELADRFGKTMAGVQRQHEKYHLLKRERKRNGKV